MLPAALLVHVQIDGAAPLPATGLLNLLSGATAVFNPNNPAGPSIDITITGGGGGSGVNVESPPGTPLSGNPQSTIATGALIEASEVGGKAVLTYVGNVYAQQNQAAIPTAGAANNFAAQIGGDGFAAPSTWSSLTGKVRLTFCGFLQGTAGDVITLTVVRDGGGTVLFPSLKSVVPAGGIMAFSVIGFDTPVPGASHTWGLFMSSNGSNIQVPVSSGVESTGAMIIMVEDM